MTTFESKTQTPQKLSTVVAHSYAIDLEEDFQKGGFDNIHIWGLTKESDPVLLRIKDYPTTCYITLPQVVNYQPFHWDESSADIVGKWLKSKFKDGALTNYHYTNKQKKLYYYRPTTVNHMLMLSFKTAKAVRFLTYTILKNPINIYQLGEMKLEIHESKISPIRKLFTARKCKTCQWFECKGAEIPYGSEGRISTAGTKDKPIREYVISWMSINPLSSQQTKGWVTYPRLFSYDFETYSDNHRAMPNKEDAKHVINIISCIYKIRGKKDSTKRFAIVIGDVVPDDVDLSKSIILRARNEIEALGIKAQLINELDPEIIMGYNILGYDIPYEEARIAYKGLTWPQLGRIQNRPPPAEIKPLTWSSSAYGKQNLYILPMEGRITIDMLPLIRRDYKLDKYSLDFVGKQFLGKGKHDVKASQMFMAYEGIMKALHSVRKVTGCKEGDEGSSIEKLVKNGMKDDKFQSFRKTLEIVAEVQYITNCAEGDEMKAITEKISKQTGQANSHHLHLQQQLRINLQEVRKHTGCLEDTEINTITSDLVKHCGQWETVVLYKEYIKARFILTIIVKYCIQDSDLVIELFEKMNVWISLIVMSSIVGITPMELFTRGQQIRCLNQLYDMCYWLGIVIDNRVFPILFYSGGFVGEPIPGIYDCAIFLDFASLYPSIMQAYNICFSTLIPPEAENVIKDTDCNICEFEQIEPADFKPRFRSKDSDKYNEESDAPAGILEGALDKDEKAERVLEAGDEKKEEKKDDKQMIKKRYKYKWITKEIWHGILPRLVKALVDERRDVRKRIKVLEKELVHYQLQMERSVSKIAEIKKRGKESGVKDPEMEYTAIEDLGEKSKIEQQFKKLVMVLIKNKSDLDSGIWDFVIPKEGKTLQTIKTVDDFDITLNNIIAILEKINERISSIQIELVVLDKQQLGLKVSANSMYGFLGAQETGALPLIEGAQSVTAYGRWLIGQVNEYAIKKYNAKIIYNDTDSSVIDLNITDRKDCDYWANKLANEINGVPEHIEMEDGKEVIVPAVPGLFPPPLQVEPEKNVVIFIFKKKKYAYYTINRDGSLALEKDGKTLKIGTRGIIIVRRDNCAYLRDEYTKMLRAILSGAKITEVLRMVVDLVVSLLTNKVPIKQLAIIKALGSDYKNQNFAMNIFAEQLKTMGRPAMPGDRLEYVVVTTNAEKRGEIEKYLGNKMRLIEMYNESQETEEDGKTDEELKEVGLYPKEEIDCMYYISKLFQNPIDQLFNVGFTKQLPYYKGIGFLPTYNKRLKGVSIETPMKMIVKFIRDWSSIPGFTLSHATQYIASLPDWFEKEKVKYDEYWKNQNIIVP